MIKEKVCVAHMLLCNCFCTRKGFMIKEKVYVVHMLLCSCSTREGFMIKESLWHICSSAATVQLQGKVL